MTYFDMNKGVYARTDLRNERPIIKPIEYITKEELEEKIMLARNVYVEMNTKITYNQNNIDDLYDKHSKMCRNVNNLMERVFAQESAPKVGKRRRRVTILQG